MTILFSAPARPQAPESALTVWRQGFAQVLPVEALQALAVGLRANDPRITQGQTTVPPPLLSLADCQCAGGDAIGFALWQGLDLQTVGEVEQAFARLCYECDQRVGEPASVRWFLNWWDDASRVDAFAVLLSEVDSAIASRIDACQVVEPNDELVRMDSDPMMHRTAEALLAWTGLRRLAELSLYDNEIDPVLERRIMEVVIRPTK